MPHNLFFLIYNSIYMVPVLYVYFFGFSSGGVEQAINLSVNVIRDMLFYYLVVFVSFYLGSFIPSLLIKGKIKGSILGCDVFVYKTSKLQDLVFLLLCVFFVLFKILIYKEGVYSSYAFDSGAMASKTWTVSMGLSELLIVFFVLFLLTGNKVKAFFSFLLISVNLLHGTRIFTLICLLVLFFYYVFHKRKLYGVKLFLYGIVSFFAVLVFFYVVFLYRSGFSNSESPTSLDAILSPIVYEAIFNQISFVKMLAFLDAGMVSFSPCMMVIDTLTFTIPNVLANAKSDLMYITKFGELSPLGGLSGYASAIIYFSDYYFVWYFFLGLFLSALLMFARTGRFFLLSKVIYVYFVCDTFFRLHRDPYFIAGKMLINNIMLLVLFFLIPFLVKSFFLKRGVHDCKC